MKPQTSVFLLYFFLWVPALFAESAPLFVTKNVSSKAFRPDAAGVLFAHREYTVFRSFSAKPADFANLYWVNIDGLKSKDTSLKTFGQEILRQPDRFAILRIEHEKDLLRTSAWLHKSGMSCGALIRLDGTVEAEKINIDPIPLLPSTSKLAQVEQMQSQISGNNIEATVAQLSSLPTRYYTSVTGQAVADDLIGLYTGYLNGRTDVEFSKFSHDSRSIPQPSLIVRIPGTDKASELVILGSHIDSINYNDQNNAPGADDNASGTATNIEIFRALMAKNYRPRRTVEIHGYAAEEIGLRGSQHIAQTYKEQGKNVIAMVQHDMNIYSSVDEDRIWFVTNSTNAALNSTLQALLQTYGGIPFSTAVLTAGSSDHASWSRLGFNAAFPFENPNAYNHNIHTANDTIENSGRFNQAAEFAKLGAAYLVHFGG